MSVNGKIKANPRPTGVSILGVLHILQGIPILAETASDYSPLLLFLGFASIFIGYGFFRGLRHSYYIAIFMHLVQLFGGIFLLAINPYPYLLIAVAMIAISSFTLMYITSEKIKPFFFYE